MWSEVYPGPTQTSLMERFATMVDGFYSLTVEFSILDVCGGPGYAPGEWNFRKTLELCFQLIIIEFHDGASGVFIFIKMLCLNEYIQMKKDLWSLSWSFFNIKNYGFYK